MRTGYSLIPSLVEYLDCLSNEGIVSIWLLKVFKRSDFFPPKEVCLNIRICSEKPREQQEFQ